MLPVENSKYLLVCKESGSTKSKGCSMAAAGVVVEVMVTVAAQQSSYSLF